MALENVIGGGEEAGLSGVISAAGTTAATATRALAQDTEVSTVASGSGVILNAHFSQGEEMTVYNSTVTSLNVYPPTGMRINSIAASSPMVLPPNTGVMFRCVSSTRIFGVLSA